MKRIIIAFILSINIYGLALGIDYQDKLIRQNIAIFYPPQFDPSGTLPSLALIKEFDPIGDIPKNWDLKPKFYTLNNQSYASLPIPRGASLYGTGEVTGSLLRNGKSIIGWNTDNFAWAKDSGQRLYQTHPWVLGVNKDGSSFGVLADNTWKQKIVLGKSIQFISEGSPFRLIVIKRKTPQEVMSALSDLIGKMPLPPLWAIGYHQCRYSYFPDTRVKEIADNFRFRNIPCDVIWMDIDYMDKYKIFTFDTEKFPDPLSLNNYLHENGFKSIWMIDPGTKVEKGYFVYDSGSLGNQWVQDSSGNEYHGKVWPGVCAFPDFTRPETRDWWAGLYTDFMAKGVDGIWNDMNEPAVFDTRDHTMPDDNIHRGGDGLPQGPHLRYHNVYGMLMARGTQEGSLKANPDKRPFVLSRAGFLGEQRYCANWSGDNAAKMEHLKMSIPMALNLGLSGQPFNGPDIGGYSDSTNPDGELYGQWIAVGAFYPFSRSHTSKGSGNKEPWAFGQKIEDVARTALNRRYRLLPYLYTLFYDSSTSGKPVMCPVFFADITDKSLRKEQQAFLLGEDLLIIPKWAKKPALPKGIWRTISIAGEDSRNDLYQPDVKLKGGKIIPLGKVIQNTTQYNLDSVTLLVALDSKGRAQGSLYEDAGDGFQYQNGEYLISNFSAVQKETNITVEINKQSGNMEPKGRFYQVNVVTPNGTVNGTWTNDTIIRVALSP